MDYINFSTHFKITNNIAQLYLHIYSIYLTCRNYYNILQSETTFLSSPNLKQLFHNSNSEKTLTLINNTETEIYDFINDWTDIFYKISQNVLHKTLSSEQILFLKFCKNAFHQSYLFVINHNCTTIHYGNPFFNISHEFIELQDSLLIIYQCFDDYKMDNFVNLLIELKLIAIIFTQIKNKILNKTIYPTIY